MKFITSKKIRAIVKHIYHRLIFEHNEAYWFKRTLSEDIPALSGELPLETSLANPDETIAWLKGFAEPWMHNVKEIRTGLPNKHYFANVKFQDKIVGYSKVAVVRVYVDDFGLIFRLPEKVSFLYHIYVLREYRKHNVAKYLVTDLMTDLRKTGFESMWCHIALWNKPSIALFTSLGFKKVAHIKYNKFAGIFRIWRMAKSEENRYRLSTHFPADVFRL